MPIILQVAVPVPLYKHFDYLPPIGVAVNQLQPGMRLRVPFGMGNDLHVGLLLAVADNTTVPAEKLKAAKELLDSTPVLPPESLSLIHWASCYYHHPIGDVVTTLLPNWLNQGKPSYARIQRPLIYKLSPNGLQWAKHSLTRMTPMQQSVWQLLRDYPEGLSKKAILKQLPNAAQTLRGLEKRGKIMCEVREEEALYNPQVPRLNEAQNHAVTQVCEHLEYFFPFLLDGVTGSGKTEVYMRVIERVLERDRQALLLVPEINLTPQVVARFQERFDCPIGVFHSKINDEGRLHTWLQARDGQLSILLGTRSAVWTPLAKPGVFIVDEEHDLSYKQQDGFRYSARDVAVMRAKRAGVPVILGSATPSLESLYNAHQRRYHHLILPERAGTALHPQFHIVDMRQQLPKVRLSKPLQQSIETCLNAQQQVLLFLNRRGYAPTFMCYHCGWVARCRRCEIHLTYHSSTHRLLCHHCGATYPLDEHCPACQHPKLHLLGQGTERIEELIQHTFPCARVLRIDSDSTQRKQAMNDILEKIHNGEADILIGTQMLAKGHHFPKVTLVGVLNIDGGLYSADFRSSERMAQLLMQVAGRAGRSEERGKVIIQTYHPDHPLFNCLIQQGYTVFAHTALLERQQTTFPPFSYLALLRAESKEKEEAHTFLKTAKQFAETLQFSEVSLWGPVPGLIERQGNWYRFQLLLQANKREPLHALLDHWLPNLPFKNTVRWSLDVDPQDLM